MKNKTQLHFNQGQTAVEYMLLLAAVSAVVLIGFGSHLPSVTRSANTYFDKTAQAIYGTPNRCGDGRCSRFESGSKCPVDCSASGGGPGPGGGGEEGPGGEEDPETRINP